MDTSRRRVLRPDDLTPAEVSLVSYAQTGGWWEPRHDDTFGPATPSVAADKGDRTVRSEVLYQLLSGHGELSVDASGQQIAVRAVRMIGAVIVGQLDLREVSARCPIEIVSCEFATRARPLLLEGASFPYLVLRHCNVPGLNAAGLRVRGDLNLRGLVSREPVILTGAEVAGSLNLQDADLGNVGGSALIATNLMVGRNLLANGDFTTEGEVNLLNATIKSQVNFDGAYVSNPGSIAIMAEGLKVGGTMFMRSTFTAEGKLFLYHADIGSSLVLDSASVSNPGQDAIDLSLATIAGNLQAGAGFKADGTFRLHDTTVKGSMLLSGATLKAGNEGVALAGDRLKVNGSLFARANLSAEGCVRLRDATIGAELCFDGAQLMNAGALALDAQRMTLDGPLYFRAGAAVTGQVSLAHCTVAGAVVFNQAKLDSKGNVVLNLDHATLKSSLVLNPELIDGYINLTGATTTEFIDGEQVRGVPTRTTGFRYEAIRPEPPTVPVADRIRWLGADPDGYGPNAYSHLAEILRKRGHADDAKRVLIESQRRRWRRTGAWGALSSSWSALLRYTIGYGYRPWLGAAWLTAVILAGSLYFDRVGPSAFSKSSGAPPFNALLYTVDSLLPFVDLGYGKWVPSGITHAVTSILVIVGWLLATALVAALAGLFRRGD
ncbi:hypothetical protein [Micromonospora zamorensis]|uniref:hypothetical protein n=1 Tax=Micromonospora zamorensis TaxID=709883 RepID=UPI0033D90F10